MKPGVILQQNALPGSPAKPESVGGQMFIQTLVAALRVLETAKLSTIMAILEKYLHFCVAPEDAPLALMVADVVKVMSR